MPIAILIGALALLAVYVAARDSAELASGAADALGEARDAVSSVVDDVSQAVSSAASSIASSWKPPARAGAYLDTINQASAQYGLPDNLLARLLYQESGFRPDVIDGTTKSSTGATGIAQFMPATARDRGVDPLDPVSSINGAAKYLRDLFNQFGSWSAALAAYNWGPGNVARHGTASLPTETKNYVANITRDAGLST